MFVYLQREKANVATANPYLFDTFKLNEGNNNSTLTTCRLEYGNVVFNPEKEYDSESKAKMFSELMNYSLRKNDYNTGTQLNVTNFTSLHPIIYFDLNFKAEKMTRGPKQLQI